MDKKLYDNLRVEFGISKRATGYTKGFNKWLKTDKGIFLIKQFKKNPEY